jgi:hypothetical protein
MQIKKFESFFERPKKSLTMEELIDKKYETQSVQLSSYEITMILRLIKNSVDKFSARGMNKMSSDRENTLKSILERLK